MTTPSPATLEREREKLFVTDAELIRRLGVPEPLARELIRRFEAEYDFPRKLPVWGDRRYFPAVKAWLDMHNGLPNKPKSTGRENVTKVELDYSHRKRI